MYITCTEMIIHALVLGINHTAFIDMSVGPDPDHPIIDKPWEYHIVDFQYHFDEEAWDNSYIDMTLVKDATVRRLRFRSPRDLKIESGFPIPTGGMEIQDVRHRQMQGIGIRVGDFEASHGAVTFWTSEVEDLDKI